MLRPVSLLAACALLWVAPACAPLDLFGEETAVTESESALDALEDDRIEDKTPAFDPARTVVETFGLCPVRMNKSATVTRLDLIPIDRVSAELDGRVFRNRGEALAAIEPLDSKTRSSMPSMEVVNGALKPFNDGLYAAVELAVQEGAAGFPGKQAFLRDLLAALLALHDQGEPSQQPHFAAAAADVAAALLLGGDSPVVPPAISSAAAALVTAFERDPVQAKPIGFYTWSQSLTRIFRQDRFLQASLAGSLDVGRLPEFGRAVALALALNSHAGLRESYESYLALNAGLTNPFHHLPVSLLLSFVDGPASLDGLEALQQRFLAAHPPAAFTTACAPKLALLPSSTSKETRFFEGFTCRERSVPDFMQALINAIKTGEVDLTPAADSGWYDFQSHALETLLLPQRAPESQHLLLTATYKQKLVDTFKSLLTQNRETHVKQLEIGSTRESAPLAPVDLYPKLPVEPFPTFYLRTARGYRFLANYLETVLGSGLLEAVHRRVEDGSESPLSLKDELRQKAELLYGLHLATADATGLAPGLLAEELTEFGDAACRERAVEWLRNWRQDADVLRDVRIALPVQQTPDGKVVYWAITGVKVLVARAEFVAGHEPRDVTYEGCLPGEVVPHEYLLVVENFAELRLPDDVPPPTREEFRAACDAHPNLVDLQAALASP